MPFVKSFVPLAASAALVILVPLAVQAQRPRPRISKDSAEVIARAAVPTGKLTASEYEHEKGRWIWSLELKVPGKSGIEEINVDARTGSIVSREHEGPGAEAREERAEKRSGKP